ncbi:hypothetical protein P43SY_007881 [Pythium insidiosum]|uniref:WDR59/RTC1-like RING zinc finger domain-containing protein n=1 Tax=Pythium insidiosum TaxID=114742 RepID=A0AAD5M4L3_PYTIN|nr:hypothetical protein P43SY_007881 [Pythium insidiosum]
MPHAASALYAAAAAPDDDATAAASAVGAAVAAAGPSESASTLLCDVSVSLRDVPATALSVDATGERAVLASRCGLHVVALDAPFARVETLHHQSNCAVDVALCSPHLATRSVVASTAQRHALVWDVSAAQRPLVATLRGHTRAVRDLAWSPADPNVLATTSADAKTLLWDLRATQRPAQTLAAVATSASLVAWHRADATSLATAHDGDVRVWDLRASERSAAAVIAAHLQPITALDWHPRRLDELLTCCAGERVVRFWNATAPRVCQGALTPADGSPVARAQFTPFGDGVVTSGGDHAVLRLWSLTYSGDPARADGSTPADPSSASRPRGSASLGGSTSGGAGGGTESAVLVDAVQSFVASANDSVKAFAWRERAASGGSSHHHHRSAFQLVSWSERREFRMWRLDAAQLEACGHDTSLLPDDASSLLSDVRPTIAPSRVAGTSVKWDLRSLKSDFSPLVIPPRAVPLNASEYALRCSIGELDCRTLVMEDDESDESAERTDPETLSNRSDDGDGERSGEDEAVGDSSGDREGDESPDGERLRRRQRKQPLQRRRRRSKPRASNVFSDDDSDASAGGEDEGDGLERHGRGARVSLDRGVSTQRRTSLPGTNAVLPCPRFSGACFSGPNMLVVFDSRVAIGQTRSSAAPPAAVAPGKTSKAAPAPLRLPRTYEQLLEMRDSRFAKKKNKKAALKYPSAGQLTGSGSALLNAMDLHSAADMWSNSPLGLPLPLDGLANDDGLYYGGGDASADPDFAVHGGSEYLKAYFTSSEHHLPVNHPDHRIAVPSLSITATPTGAVLSPRGSTIRTNPTGSGGPVSGSGVGPGGAVERAKRLDAGAGAPAVALNLDLSLSVTVLDLSRLCGISPVLTFETRLKTQSRPRCGPADGATPALDAGSRDLYAWLLTATQTARARHARGRAGRRRGLPTAHPLARVLTACLDQRQPQRDEGAAPAPSASASASARGGRVSDLCEHNAHIATLAGRTDLCHVWSLLQLSTASQVSAGGVEAAAETETLSTAHQWRAHPFGRPLVHKILSMYEQAGDLPTLASIVCALRPESAAVDDGDEPAVGPATPPEPIVATTRPSVAGGTPPARGVIVASPAHGGKPQATTSPFSRPTRSSFNGISQFLLNTTATTEPADAAPAMRNARRSSSHNEVPKAVPPMGGASQKDAAPLSGPSKLSSDWPLPRAPVQRSPSFQSGALESSGSGWKSELEKIESSVKTWGGSAAKDQSPCPTTQDVFRVPAASPIRSSNRKDSASHETDAHEETLSALGRVFLQVNAADSARSAAHDLLSSDPLVQEHYDVYKSEYAELLYRYGAMNLRSEVLKTTTAGVQEDKAGLQLEVVCRSCESPTNGLYCRNCRDFAVKCSICQLVVRGQSMFCVACGHGGHESHLREWFETEKTCPTGCGCWCTDLTAAAVRATTMESSSTAAGELRGQMKGSGLSLERFIKGKAHKTKAQAKSKKKAIIHKAQLKRQYEKVKKKEQQAKESAPKDENGPTSFYDRFFSELKNEDGDNAPRGGKGHMDFKPDPFFKAKKKAEVVKQEKQRNAEERQKRQDEKERKVNERKKRHVKLSVRTATGQPVVRNRIKDILSKLQAEQGSR